MQGDGSDDDVEDWDELQAALQWKPDPVEVGMIDRCLYFARPQPRARNAPVLTIFSTCDVSVP